jgi:hypothetical protein
MDQVLGRLAEYVVSQGLAGVSAVTLFDTFPGIVEQELQGRVLDDALRYVTL